MTAKRSRLEIYLDILQALKKGVIKPTRIMYSTNLSWNPLQEILESLIEQGLVEEKETKNRKRYEITEKGLAALKYFNKTKELVVVGGQQGLRSQIYPPYDAKRDSL